MMRLTIQHQHPGSRKEPKYFLVIRFTHPAMMTRYGWGAVRAQA